jgi:hypothetical protein
MEFSGKKLSLTIKKWTSHSLGYNKIIVMQWFFNLCVVVRKQEDKSY